MRCRLGMIGSIPPFICSCITYFQRGNRPHPTKEQLNEDVAGEGGMTLTKTWPPERLMRFHLSPLPCPWLARLDQWQTLSAFLIVRDLYMKEGSHPRPSGRVKTIPERHMQPAPVHKAVRHRHKSHRRSVWAKGTVSVNVRQNQRKEQRVNHAPTRQGRQKADRLLVIKATLPGAPPPE